MSDKSEKIGFVVNGKEVEVVINSAATLLEVLRDVLELKGTKPGCNEGECGACTVLIDDKPVNSCLFFATRADGCRITTIEGLASDNGALHVVQEALIAHGAVQCGFCTSGMALNIEALQRHYRNTGTSPTPEEIKKWIEGNLCRCTGYVKIVDAAQSLFNKKVES